MSGGRPRTRPFPRMLPYPRCGQRGAATLATNSHCTFGYVCQCGFEGYGGRAYAPTREAVRGWNEAVRAWREHHGA